MEREQLKGKQTSGKYNVGSGRPGSAKTITVKENVVAVLNQDDQATALCGSPLHNYAHANATLYAEAHNVANRTGMWPEDMERRIKELEEALRPILKEAEDELVLGHTPIAYLRKFEHARAILNKSK